jgi:hypothetical protein
MSDLIVPFLTAASNVPGERSSARSATDDQTD